MGIRLALVLIPAVVMAQDRLIVGYRDDGGQAERRLGLRPHRRIPGGTVIQVPTGSGDAVRRSLQSTGLFRYVEPDHVAHGAAITPNDPSYPYEWHIPATSTDAAWNVASGSGITVAVIDSGIDATHPDLQSRIVPGWNFVTDGTDTSDPLGHGTMVSGVIAAELGNHTGIAGVAFGASIMPLVALAENNNAWYSDIAAAIQYAADRGARIINVSLGADFPSEALQDAVDYAWNRGTLVIAAAMNQSSTTKYYPAACEHAVSVSAIDKTGKLAAFSNYGHWITLAAPGFNILTTAPGGAIWYGSGTSFASPVVAGIAALALSINPRMDAETLQSVLISSADDIGDVGHDSYFGWGLVNAQRAVRAALHLTVHSAGRR